METILEAASVERLLSAAKDVMAKAKYCWAVTTAENGRANARPMGRLPNAPGDDAWIVWFMTRRASRKALEIDRAGQLTVVFQHDADDGYVTLIGRPEIITDRAIIRSRWHENWNRFFPGGAEDDNAIFVRTEAARLELWVRGVTPEPFGARTTILERTESRKWCEMPR